MSPVQLRRRGDPPAWIWHRPLTALIGSVLALGAELAVCSFLVEQLCGGGLTIRIQLLVSAVITWVYTAASPAAVNAWLAMGLALVAGQCIGQSCSNDVNIVAEVAAVALPSAEVRPLSRRWSAVSARSRQERVGIMEVPGPR